MIVTAANPPRKDEKAMTKEEVSSLLEACSKRKTDIFSGLSLVRRYAKLHHSISHAHIVNSFLLLNNISTSLHSTNYPIVSYNIYYKCTILIHNLCQVMHKNQVM